LTVATPLPVVVAGLVVLTMGFFGLHGIASGWVAARATALAGVPGQASSAYLVAYYGGSSVVGTLAGLAWSVGGWAAVLGLCGSLFAAALWLTLALRRVPGAPGHI
jgi:YNFM family putative membrane transporter